MSWSDNNVQSGTIYKIDMPHEFTRLVSIYLYSSPKSKRPLVYLIHMAKIRQIANGILGYKSESITEIRNTFENFALNKEFIAFTDYYTEGRKRHMIKANGWTIL